MDRAAFCREQADQAREAAADSTLSNVRDRCLRSADAWDQMAARAERVGRERAAREAATAKSSLRDC